MISDENIYKVYESPDSQYRIVIYTYPGRFSMPGGAGDGPGLVCLYDVTRDTPIKFKSVDMAARLDQVNWHPRSVEIYMFAEWEF